MEGGCADQWNKSKFGICIIVLQVIFTVLFGLFSNYQYDIEAETRWFYPMFQNVHVMMYIGFGFLMTFLRRYGFAALSINFLIASLVTQWFMLFKGLVHLNADNEWKFGVGMVDLITAEFTAAAILISFGAVIGKVSPFQLVVMALVEVMVFVANEYVAVEIFQVSDVGGSMLVHAFGAYFGLAVSRVINDDAHCLSTSEGSCYHSDIFSMIGTLFLWLFWPSFNAAVAGSEQQQVRAVINTYLSLCACTLITFAVSSLVNKDGKFNMVHIQNATLAGGVAVGTAANFMIEPWGAMLIGILAGVVSTVGFEYLQEFLLDKIGLHDTCGVNNLHGLPGIMAAIIGIVGAAVANTDTYKAELVSVFPAMLSMNRTASAQAGYQAATLGTTLGLALVGGALTGVLLRYIPGLNAPGDDELYSDDKFFDVPENFPQEQQKEFQLTDLNLMGNLVPKRPSTPQQEQETSLETSVTSVTSRL